MAVVFSYSMSECSKRTWSGFLCIWRLHYSKQFYLSQEVDVSKSEMSAPAGVAFCFSKCLLLCFWFFPVIPIKGIKKTRSGLSTSLSSGSFPELGLPCLCFTLALIPVKLTALEFPLHIISVFLVKAYYILIYTNHWELMKSAREEVIALLLLEMWLQLQMQMLV